MLFCHARMQIIIIIITKEENKSSSTGNVMLIVLWDVLAIIFIDYFPRRKAINDEHTAAYMMDNMLLLH